MKQYLEPAQQLKATKLFSTANALKCECFGFLMRHTAAFVDLRFGFIDLFKQFEASLHSFELVYVREYGYAFTVLGNNERSFSLIYLLYVRANAGSEV